MSKDDGDVINLNATRGKRTAQIYQVEVPKVGLGLIANDPKAVVDALELCAGNVEEFAKQFMGDSYKDRMKVLMETMMLLNKPENSEHKRRWYALIAAFKEAKVLMAENAAFEFIAKYNPAKTNEGKPRNVSPAQYATICNLWMKEQTNAAATKGRRKGAKPEEDHDETRALGGILGTMQEEDDE